MILVIVARNISHQQPTPVQMTKDVYGLVDVDKTQNPKWNWMNWTDFEMINIHEQMNAGILSSVTEWRMKNEESVSFEIGFELLGELLVISNIIEDECE